MNILQVFINDIAYARFSTSGGTPKKAQNQVTAFHSTKSELLDPKKEKSPTCCNFENFDHDTQLEMKF